MCTAPVWVVDDDEDDLYLIRIAFESGSTAVSTFTLSNSADLLPNLSKCKIVPRLILLDINMPCKNGFETLQELRAIPTYANVPVVMLTTSSTEVERNRSLALGANQFLIKPTSLDQLKYIAQQLSEQWDLV